MLTHAFTTPISRTASGLAPDCLRAAVAALKHRRAHDPGEARSNQGGWHSSGNLFAERDAPPWDIIRAAVTRAVFAYIGEAFAWSGTLEFSLTAWAIVNGPGDFNVMHNHATHLLSGALYLQVPQMSTGGEIHFQDPRLNLNGYETEAMLRLKLRPPWHIPGITIQPTEGEILIFPSWLMHCVYPFTANDADAQRIVLSFNVRI